MASSHSRIRPAWWLLAIVIVALWWLWQGAQDEGTSVTQSPRQVSLSPGAERAPESGAKSSGLPDFLPAQAHHTIGLVQRGGPYPYRQDGTVFGNREGRLPQKSRGWYREFTVDTPGLSHRGARRIVTGGDPPETWYYTSDHYESFRRFEVPGDRP